MLEIALPLGIVVMTVLWIHATRKRDASIVDVAWSLLLGLFAVIYAAYADGENARRLLIGAMGGLWSLRLTTYLFRDRILRASHEDGRYQKLRATWGSRATRNFFIFFHAQGVLALLLSIPFLVAASRSGPIDVADIAGVLLWLTGLVGESIADHQLARFRRSPQNRGRTCREGLWRYSRHPNYFFEWLMWCSYAVVAGGTVAGWSWLTWLAPITMLLLIWFVTGIPPTEARALETRGDDYRHYQRTTSPFFPWFPKAAPAAERSP